MAEQAVRAVVTGRVQGVGFREFAETRARGLRLRGFVWNREDGAVEVVAEGEKDRLELLIEQLRDGPRMARVDGVEVEWGAATGEYRDFRTRW